MRLVIICTFLAFCTLGCRPADQQQQNSAFQAAIGERVDRSYQLSFPKDHGAHEKQGIEWWYITANLESETGESFGVQWTLFRTLMPSKIESQWWDNNLYFAHFALQHQQQHVAFERFARANQAQVTSKPFIAQIDNWNLNSTSQEFLPLSLVASQDDYNIDLSLSDSPLILHGENGYSQKTDSGHASYYYSFPFLNVKGSITFAGKEFQVTGNAWLDREWSASLINKNQLGWDWFSLVEENKENSGLMLFCIRGGKQDYDYCSGTQINEDGNSQAIARKVIQLSVLETINLDGRSYPQKWQVDIEDKQPIIIETVTNDSRNKLTIPYWEGRVRASGGFKGKGYAELTGY